MAPLISRTFLWQFECTAGTKVGLAAGRYSGKRRPDRYRTPQALHSVLGPIGPSLHCGVFVTSQCMHFLGTAEPCDENLFISASSESMKRSFFLCFFALLSSFSASPVSKSDSEAGVLWCFRKAGELRMKGTENRELQLEGRRRLLRARFAGMTGRSKLEFSTEEELLLSKTETGL